MYTQRRYGTLTGATTREHAVMRSFRLRNIKECTLCLVTLVVVAGTPILVSIIVLLRG